MATTIEKTQVASAGLNVNSALLSADQAVAQLVKASEAARADGDYKPLLVSSGERATEILTALTAFLAERPLLNASEAPGIRQLSASLKDKGDAAAQGAKGFLEAHRQALIAKGAIPIPKDQLQGWNEQMLAQELAGKADELKKPAFAEYFGSWMIVPPGTASDRDARIKQAREEVDSGATAPAGILRNAAAQAERRLEITEAQFKPVRTIEEMTQASVERGIKNGYPADGMGSKIGYALQDLMNHQEIQLFASQLWSMALDSEFIKAKTDPKERSEAALNQTLSWVNHFGRNERTIDQVWTKALEALAKGS